MFIIETSDEKFEIKLIIFRQIVTEKDKRYFYWGDFALLRLESRFGPKYETVKELKSNFELERIYERITGDVQLIVIGTGWIHEHNKVNNFFSNYPKSNRLNNNINIVSCHY